MKKINEKEKKSIQAGIAQMVVWGIIYGTYLAVNLIAESVTKARRDKLENSKTNAQKSAALGGDIHQITTTRSDQVNFKSDFMSSKIGATL